MMSSVVDEQFTKEQFVQNYVNFICEMTHLSKITKFFGSFYELILFLHDGGEIHHNCLLTHKIKNNCFFVNNVFDENIKFRNFGVEYQNYVKYIAKYCPSEIQSKITNNNTHVEISYKCNFKCPTTFLLIKNKLLSLGYTRELLQLKKEELSNLKQMKNVEEYEKKHIEFQQMLITIKNICTFVKAVNDMQI